MKSIICAAVALVVLSSAAIAAPTVDGSGPAGEYNAGSSVVVGTDANATEGNFGAPSSSARAGYTINLTNENGSLFGLVSQTGGTAVAPFANLYFDLDSATRSGSDLGFEINGNGGVNAFIPGVAGSVALMPSLFNTATMSVGGLTNVEFRLDNSLFSTPIAGLNYNAAQTFNNQVRLNLSQSLSYSVAGGQAGFGSARLGTFNISPIVGAVPEPGTWAMMLLGFGLVGAALRGRRATAGANVSIAA